MNREKVTATLGGLALATVLALGVSAHGNGNHYPPTGNGGSPTPIWDDPPVTTDGTIAEPIYQDTQTAVAATLTAEASPIATEFPTVILPNTGAGSTSR